MAERKIVGLSGPVDSPEIAADCESAELFDKLRVGARGVYFRDGFRTRFLDYPSLERVFIRVQQVNGRMCCGTANFEYFRLVFVRGGKEIADYMSEKGEQMDRALERIHERAPEIAVGFVPPADRA